MKDCFMCLRASGGFSRRSSIVSSTFSFSSSSLNSSSSGSGFSLGFCQTVCSISGSSGMIIELLDRSPCLKKMRFYSYSNFSIAAWMVSGTVLDLP